jgi:GT2 family glycosyltransferase
MNYKDITVGIVVFKSENVIFDCLKSIKKLNKIIIYDNSNDISLKNRIIKKYPKIKYILSKKNIGYGAANNKIFKIAKTPYVFVVSPDTILNKNCIQVLINQSNKFIKNFSIISPAANEKNYGFFSKKIIQKKKSKNIINVDYVKGFAMLINVLKIKKIGMFDENIFLYMEEIDLCRRLKHEGENIFLIKNAKIKHLFAKSSNIGFEYEKCRNWHWMWSKVYCDIKNFSYSYSVKKYFFTISKNLIKSFLHLIFLNFKKSKISYLRASGIINSLIGKKSFYRPKIN